jgi:hypothetical protein
MLPSLSFWPAPDVRAFCFFYKSKVQYLWVSPGP